MNYNQWFSRVNSISSLDLPSQTWPYSSSLSLSRKSTKCRPLRFWAMNTVSHHCACLRSFQNGAALTLHGPSEQRGCKLQTQTKSSATGLLSKTSATTGSSKSTITISLISTCGEWTRFSSQWPCLWGVVRHSSVGVITKKCRKNITTSAPSS